MQPTDSSVAPAISTLLLRKGVVFLNGQGRIFVCSRRGRQIEKSRTLLLVTSLSARNVKDLYEISASVTHKTERLGHLALTSKIDPAAKVKCAI